MRFAITVIVTLLFFSFHAVAAPGLECSQLERVCTEGAGTRMVSGVQVTKECWKYQTKYVCGSNDTISDCQVLKDNGCGQIGSRCISTSPSGTCMMFEQKYQCTVKPAETETINNCSANTFCVNENGQQRCFDAGSSPDPDFGNAVAMLESMRELGTYIDTNSFEIFKGEDNRCSKKLGISNCCKPSNGGNEMSNMVMAAKAGITVAGQSLDAGSGYVYDALMSSGSNSMAQGLKSMTNSLGGDFSFNPSVSYMGFGVSYGAPAAGSTALMSSTAGAADLYNAATAAAQAAQAAQAAAAAAEAAAVAAGTAEAAAAAEAAAVAAQTATATAEAAAAASSATASGSGFVYFNPTMFYVAIALMVYAELTKCEQEEQALSMKIGQKLCHAVGSYCSQDSIFGCITVKETHCCFNSRLARILNEQARNQLGMGWGSPENPQCSGLTLDDFQGLDFSKIDLSEFIQEITPKTIDASTVTNKASQSVQDIAGKYNQSTGGANYYAQ